MACYQLSLQRSMLAILFYYLCLCNISTLAWKESSTSIKVSKVYKSHMALHTSSRPDQQDTVSQQPSIFKAPKKLLSQISVAVMITSVFDVTSMKLPVRAEESITATTASEGIQRLQTTIQKLEQSDNRADTVQAMADLFEAIQAKPITAKSLKVRTVSLTVIPLNNTYFLFVNFCCFLLII